SDQCNGGNPEDDMRDIACQKRTRIGLVGNNPQLLTLGAYNRNESLQSGGQYVHVRCVAGINLLQLLGAGIVNSPAPFYTTGGWAIINLINPPPFSSGGLVTESITQGDYDAFVYDLKFGALTSLIASPAGNAMVNDGKIIRTRLESTAPRMTDTNP
ncbi:MAG TPA: hypothetical protein VN328_09985, partial [Thermodesulfovibrionales bacterium]|nr:hypothetical protein [Thermodesulfovibrionales bacterium]